jgi:hypothetical protein
VSPVCCSRFKVNYHIHGNSLPHLNAHI